jgi:hypothetical protein
MNEMEEELKENDSPVVTVAHLLAYLLTYLITYLPTHTMEHWRSYR